MKKEINELTVVISKDLELNQELPVPSGLEELITELSVIIGEMITHDFNRLVNILYRIDVSEEKVKKAMGEQSPEDVPRKIAELIVERELQKLETRRRYRQ